MEFNNARMEIFLVKFLKLLQLRDETSVKHLIEKRFFPDALTHASFSPTLLPFESSMINRRVRNRFNGDDRLVYFEGDAYIPVNDEFSGSN